MPTESRYQGIWDLLNSYEIRDVKSHAEKWTFQHDILGCLPLELAGRVAQHLDPTDLFILRRVSRRWNTILSQRYVLSSFIHARIRPLQRTMPVQDLEDIIQTRWRLETGNPLAERRFPISTPFQFSESKYCSGWLAFFPEDLTDRNQQVACVEIQTGVVKYFTTDNRVELYDIQLTDLLVSAVTSNGYCYVWNYRHHFSNACNIVFEYESTSTVVFFCFTSGRARTIDVGAKILALNPAKSSESHCSTFTILTIERKDGQNITSFDISQEERGEYQLQVRVNQGESTMAECPVSQTQGLLSLLSPWIESHGDQLHTGSIVASGSKVFSGQRSSYLRFNGLVIHFSLGHSAGITMHFVPRIPHELPSIHISHGLMYLIRRRFRDCLEIFIASGLMISDMPSGITAYDLTTRPANMVGKDRRYICEVQGDDSYILLNTDYGVRVWSFGELLLDSS
ncbi:uncharacterized protein N7506_001551 [Penicillium brevicompactum]|uniref:uncharacterized protein n=1 Tax=Penicillium brevicompactum TaxID=5074 RepID=UPI002541B06D|nr:uncharacterized protein N7506_001551 [Penicillium brevicompactum]KAJ5348298.1 hypothetical protein N7506_001551 [Penicillium brevicompactum]